ncbi:MAG: OmpH family outer membrane protein [Rikenellaceae bacterium]|nr:OmpH family outer membrane protein [Rikenellaceae bacterium]
MKTITKLTLFVALLLVCGSTYAQKFGYINSQELIMLMPERDSALTKFTQSQKEYSDMLEMVGVEYQTKLDDLNKNLSTMTDAVKQLREKELNDLATRYQELEQQANQQLSQLQQELMAPVLEKAVNAIKKVGKDNGFTIVFDQAVGATIYIDDACVNILPLVKTELGIK